MARREQAAAFAGSHSMSWNTSMRASQAFEEVQSVKGTIPDTEAGLGPRFNLDSCGGCHAQPAVGGSSPAVNPQVALANKFGADNVVPFFITRNGPVREVRFKFADPPANTIPDGGVHALFTIKGRSDAFGCNITQPDFADAAAQGNLVFRIPTPTFGLGLVEAIKDSTILANIKNPPVMGISGRVNREGNAGTVTRFGWKAQNKSLVIFSGEAYNVEQGVTNELFPQERDETPSCQFNRHPENHMDFEATATGGRVRGRYQLCQFHAIPGTTDAGAFVRQCQHAVDRERRPAVCESRLCTVSHAGNVHRTELDRCIV